MTENGKSDTISIVARDAPFGNEFTSPLGVCVRSGRLVYYDLDNYRLDNSDLNSPTFHSNFEPEEQDSMSLDFDRLSLSVGNNKSTLPSISAYSPNGTSPNGIKELFIKNGNLTMSEENDLIKDIMVSMQNIDGQRLISFQTDISDYDPHQRGLVDASSLQRILSKFFKLIPLTTQSTQKLFRLFATDPKRPRQIQYVQLVQYLTQIKEYMGQNINASTSPGKLANVPTAGSSMAQSPFYKRGDAKLILELQLSLQQAKVNSIDVESIRRALNVLDRGHSGTLSREQIESVLKNFHLYSPLESVMTQFLQRCNLSNDDQYDWATVVRFLEKAQPASFQEQGGPAPVSKARRDMVSSLDSPTSTNGTSFPPITNNFHVQQNGYSQKQTNGVNGQNGDHKKLLEETEMQMKALMIRRQQLELEMSKKSKQENGEKNGATNKVDNRPRSAGKLIEQLKKLDTSNSGFVSMANARTVIQQYNDLHELGLNSKFLQHILVLCANDTETHVNLQQLANYLTSSFK